MDNEALIFRYTDTGDPKSGNNAGSGLLQADRGTGKAGPSRLLVKTELTIEVSIYGRWARGQRDINQMQA